MRASIVVVFLCLTTAAAHAGEPWETPFATDLKALARAAAKVPAAPDADATILIEDGKYSYDAQGRLTLTLRRVSRVERDAAADWLGTYSWVWVPWYQARPQVRARVLAPDGTARELDATTVEERPFGGDNALEFSDRRLLRAPLPGVSAGAIVEIQTTQTETASFFPAGRLDEFLLALNLDARLVRLEIEAPASLPLQVKVLDAPGVEPRRSVAGGVATITVERRNVAGLPDDEESAPPGWPRAEIATGRSWNEVAGAYAKIVDQAVARADVADLAREARGDATTPADIAARLVDRVHRDVRYASVSFGDASILPRDPGETRARQFGDCKDQATLLVALLRASGVPAHVALLRAGEGIDVDPALPGLSFNHAIVYVPGKPALWIDPTDRYARAGEVPVADQGRRALVAAPDTRELITTPISRAADNRRVIERIYTLAEQGPARAVEITRRTGWLESEYRAYRDSADLKADRDHLQEYVEKVFAAKKLEALKATPPRDLSVPCELRLEASGAERGFTSDKKAEVFVFPASPLGSLPDILTSKPATGAERHAPYVLPQPVDIDIVTRAAPPPGYVSRALPDTRRIDAGPFHAITEFARAADGSVSARTRMSVERVTLAPAEFDAVRSQIADLLDEDGVAMVFERIAEEHLAAGRPREAIDEERRLAKLHPGEALHARRLADALLRAGLGDAARLEARRATELAPRDADAWEDLGFTLIHDPLGRTTEPGWEPAEAEAAYRKAIALDPERQNARLNLAIILEHDAAAVRYAKGARLAEAADLYRALWREHKNADAGRNLLFLLMYMARVDELLAHAETQPATEERDGVVVAAVAAASGSETGIAEARKRTRDEAALKKVLLAASSHLMHLRRYDEARALHRQTGQTLPDLQTAVRRFEEVVDRSDEPLRTARRFVATLYARDPAALRDVTLRDELLNGGVDDLWYEARRSVASSAWSPEVIADYAGSRPEYKVWGAARDWRVWAPPILDGTREHETLFLMKQADRLVVAGVNDVSRLAAPALEALQAGHVDEARLWLGWMRHSSKPQSEEASGELVDLGENSDRGSLEAAAALMMAETSPTDATLGALERCSAPSVAEPRRTRCALARAWGLALRGRPAEALKIYDAKLSGVKTGPLRHAAAYVVLLEQAGRADDAQQELLTTRAQAPEAIDWQLVTAALILGRCERARQVAATLPVKVGPAAFVGYCAALAGDPVTAEDVTRLEGTIAGAGNSTRTLRRGLAVVLAERGALAEAHKALDELALPGAPLDETHWLALGRLSEELGFTEAARRSYRRIAKPSQSYGLSVWSAAQRRLAALK